MLTYLRSLVALAVGLLHVVAIAASGTNAQTSVQRQLAAVRQATAKYHDVNAAIRDGYLPTEHCIVEPGLGGMGYHYLNPRLASDLALDPLQPELLLYAPSGNGLRLVAVEYFVADLGQDHPVLFGRPFDGPMAGHEPGMPTHYDLHAWIWQANPDGVLTAWNPTVHC